MTAGVLVVTPGPATTLQDGGRWGFARAGIPRSGPMDVVHHRLAALLAGRRADEAGRTLAIEVGPGGATLAADGGPVDLAVAGPDLQLGTAGAAAVAVVLRLEPGASLHVHPGAQARWGYVVPVQPVAVAAVLGSRSMHPRSGLGPSLGAPWRLEPAGSEHDRPRPTLGHRIWQAHDHGPLGLLPAAQTDRLDQEARALLVAGAYRTTTAFDRMGHRLAGPPLVARGGHDVISDGVVPGAVQVPGDGVPFVLTADHQTTGGYAKVAVLAVADLARFVQLPAGRVLDLAWIDVDEALHRRRAALAAVARCAAGPVTPDADHLAGDNLIGGVALG